jgi:hypothetical protein
MHIVTTMHTPHPIPFSSPHTTPSQTGINPATGDLYNAYNNGIAKPVYDSTWDRESDPFRNIKKPWLKAPGLVPGKDISMLR